MKPDPSDTMANWVRTLVAALLSAAAAWGSVTVEIRRVVEAQVGGLELRLQHRLDTLEQGIDDARSSLRAEVLASIDSSRAMLPGDQPPPAAPRVVLVPAPRDTAADRQRDAMVDAMEARLDALLYEVVRQRAEREAWRSLLEKPRKKNDRGAGNWP